MAVINPVSIRLQGTTVPDGQALYGVLYVGVTTNDVYMQTVKPHGGTWEVIIGGTGNRGFERIIETGASTGGGFLPV